MLFSFTASAADKNGVSPNSISLPKGPGSIEGLGDSFQPTLNTGTAKHGLGVKLPPGVAGHQPALSLSYDGGGANGPLGFGWNLPLRFVQRRTDKGIPTYGEALGVARPDTFINETKEELVPRDDGFFFCENEGAFIRYHRAGGHWEGTRPDGTKLEFGVSASARIEDSATSRVFCWLLERETDTRGNVIEYAYRSYPGDENLNQKYLAAVRYGPGAPPWTHFHFATFEYEDRADWFEDARAGFFVRTGKRLKRIHIGSQGAALSGHLAGDFDGDGTADYLNRRYVLAYLKYAGANSHWSLLEEVTLIGADGATALPPAKFGYGVSNPPPVMSAQGKVWGAINEPAAVMDNELVELADLNADGLPDILKTESGGGAHTVSVNRGPLVQPGGAREIQWATPVAVDPGNGSAWNFDLASDSTHLADMDGDGLADLVHKSADDLVFFFANRSNLTWGERQEMTLEGAVPPAAFGNPGVRTADVDFDKRIDVIQSLDLGGGVGYRVWFNSGDKVYSAPFTVEPEGGFDFALPGVQIADGNGDRVPDVARIQPGAVRVAAGLGYGRFAAAQSMVLPDITLDDLQITKAKLTDINGDGLADLVLERAAPGACWYWLNLGNYTFSPRKVITDLPAGISGTGVIRWADLNGNGTTDLIYADSQAVPRIQMVDLGELVSGGLSPNLLIRIGNGIGQVTRIEYAPSTSFALADAAAGNAWPDALPFPVTVVSKVTVSDSLGHEYVARFQYHNGYYDPVEKQFRGFARVEQIAIGDATAPTLVSRSHFDTGREFDAMKGLLLRASVETEDGRVFSEETTTWANPPKTLMTGTNGLPVRFAHPVSSTKTILELGRGTPRRLESEVGFDDFGNQVREANYGIVEGGDRSAFDDERITLTEYALNLQAWIIRLPKRQTIQDENGDVISRSESFYDDDTFTGNNLGAVSVGNLTLQRDWIDPANDDAFISLARTKYDRFGNPIALFDPLADAAGDGAQGHFRELAYDEDFHAYPVRETIHVGGGKPGLIYQASYDRGLAIISSSTDLNGNTTSYAYDALGRLINVVKPGDTLAYPTSEYDYALAVPFGNNSVVNYVESRALDKTPGTAGGKRDHYIISRQFSDGLGRQLMSKIEAEPAAGSTAPRVTVNGAVLFNARQKPSIGLNAFFTVMTGSLEELLAFENIEAPDWLGQFHENGVLATLDLAAAHKSLSEYDATLRVIRTTNPDGSSGRADFEPLLTRAFDENDSDPASPHFETPTVQFSDGLGRLIRVDEISRLNDDGTPSGALNTWTTRYRYDLNDALTRITDSQNNVKELRYDGLKRKTWMNDPDAGISTDTYDAASNLIETIDAKGQRITYTYDGVNRLLTEDFHDGNSPEFSYRRSPDVAYFYDAPAAMVDHGDGTRATARNTRGVLAYVDDASGQEHTSFDARGRVEWTVKRIPDPTLELMVPPFTQFVSYATRFEYDSLDRVTRMIYPDNDEVTYEYNARSLLAGIVGGPSGRIVSAIGYLPSAQQQTIGYGNGVQTAYHYDGRQRLTSLLTHHASRVTEPFINFRYQFDAASNIKAIDDQRPESVVAAGDKRRNSQAFTYDDLYRLTRVQYNQPAPSSVNGGAINYRYDRIGNMLAQTSDIAHLEKGLPVTDLGDLSYGGSAGATGRAGRPPGAPPGPHALTSITNPASQIPARSYDYDANGNMTEIDGLTCSWDFKNRLVAVEDDTMRAEYTYDFTDRRITKNVVPKQPATNNGPLTTIYVGKHFEVRDHDQPTKFVFSGSTRVARIIGSLSTNTRIQRFRLYAGWNLISLAVSANDLAGRFNTAPGLPAIVSAMYQWNPQTAEYVSVGPGQTLAAGSVLWVKATANAIVSVVGSYAEPVNWQVASGGGYVPAAGFETWTPEMSPTAAAWTWLGRTSPDAPLGGNWHARLNGDLASVSNLLPTLNPGGALYVSTQTAVELEVPDPALRIRHYHQDHLGSSSVVTDADGTLIEETAFYPFGISRNEYRLLRVEEHYKFTQKERDRESGLHYLEARYLAASAPRFASVDSKYANPDKISTQDFTTFLSQPQRFNLYAYALSNPIRYSDPTGFDAKNSHNLNSADNIVAMWGVAFDALGADVHGAVADVASIGIKAAKLYESPSEENAVGFVWNLGEIALTKYSRPAGVALQLTGLLIPSLTDPLDMPWVRDPGKQARERKLATELKRNVELALFYMAGAKSEAEGIKSRIALKAWVDEIEVSQNASKLPLYDPKQEEPPDSRTRMGGAYADELESSLKSLGID